jgi:hypothetical protein
MFRSWCEGHSFVPVPTGSQAVILLSNRAGQEPETRLATLNRRLAAVSELHHQMHFDSPTHSWKTKKFMAGPIKKIQTDPRGWRIASARSAKHRSKSLPVEQLPPSRLPSA